MPLKLISINVERSKHLDTVIPFLEKEAADVVCIQEVMEYDVPMLEKALGAASYVLPIVRHPGEGRPGAMCVGIFSRLPILSRRGTYYHGSGEIRDFDMTSVATKYASESLPFIYCDVEKSDGRFRIGTTHFTWTPDGKPDEYQRRDLQKLLPILSDAGEMVLCGDFNAPRGGEIFNEIAQHYKDNIPSEYIWSLDPTLHRVSRERLSANAASAGLPGFMIDVLFTTPTYRAANVHLVSGVSDHMAIVAEISRI